MVFSSNKLEMNAVYEFFARQPTNPAFAIRVDFDTTGLHACAAGAR
jgi:hypothetical protein